MSNGARPPYVVSGSLVRAAAFLSLATPARRREFFFVLGTRVLASVAVTMALYWVAYGVINLGWSPTARLQAAASVHAGYGVKSEKAESKGAVEGGKTSCTPDERAAMRFSLSSETELLATIVPSANCPQPLVCDSLRSGDCVMSILALERNILGIPTPVLKNPIQAVTRKFEEKVSQDSRIIQCTTSTREEAGERALCRHSADIESDVEDQLDGVGLTVLRKINGTYQVLSVFCGVLLVIWTMGYSHAMRRVHRDVPYLSRAGSGAPDMPWDNSQSLDDAYDDWNAFLAERDAHGRVTGRMLAEASPYLAGHGAAITALKFGQDVHEAIERSIAHFREKAEIANGVSRYLVYAIPTFGFLGTVMGMAAAMKLTSVAQSADPARQAFARAILGDHVVVAFDTTMMGLAVSLVALCFLYFLGQVTESNIEQVRQDVYESVMTGALKRFVPVVALGQAGPIRILPRPPAPAPTSHASGLSSFLLLALLIAMAVVVVTRLGGLHLLQGP